MVKDLDQLFIKLNLTLNKIKLSAPVLNKLSLLILKKGNYNAKGEFLEKLHVFHVTQLLS